MKVRGLTPRKGAWLKGQADSPYGRTLTPVANLPVYAHEPTSTLNHAVQEIRMLPKA